MRSIVVAVVLSLSTACGAARAPLAAFAELPDSVNHGDTITVEDADGTRNRGERAVDERIAAHNGLAAGSVLGVLAATSIME